MSSQLLLGQVQHRRFSPVKHSLSQSIFMPAIDLDELEILEKEVRFFGQQWWHWARFCRKDYLGEGDLKIAAQNKVQELTGVRVDGKVILVGHLRYLGLYFSPVNFYYLFDNQGEWRYLLAEVSNTPWNERHYYAIASDPSDGQWNHDKEFHVSPFNPMDQRYKWRIKPLSSRLFLRLECHQEQKVFDATLIMKGKSFNSKNLLSVLIRTPSQTVKMLLGIYWHALKLWFKKAPIYDHKPQPEAGKQPYKDINGQSRM